MKLDKKQKIILVCTVLAFLFVGWQVYDMMFGDLGGAPPVKVVQRQRVKKIVQRKKAPKKVTKVAKLKVEKKLPSALQQEQKQVADNQTQVIKITQQYQIAKLQRQLLSEEAGIASAKQKIALIHQKTSQLDQGPVPNAAIASGAANAEQLWLAYIDNQAGHQSATIVIGNHYQNIAVGSLLPGNERVLKIDNTGVTLKKNKQRMHLTFDGLEKIV